MTSDELHAAIMNLPAKSTTVDGLANAVERAVYKLGHRDARHAAAELVSAAASARDSEVERLREALNQIVKLSERPFDGFPADWDEQIAACPDCQRYKDHPIQQGICDKHRQPLWARERHTEHETRAIGWRAQVIARAALSSQVKESGK